MTIYQTHSAAATDAEEFFPKCIYVDFRRSIIINAVGLSNKGAEWLFAQNRWQQRTDNFFLSFMAMGTTRDERRNSRFCEVFTLFLPQFHGKVGLH